MKANIIIFGATGDLTKRKLIPALYQLYIKGKLNSPIICTARKNLTKEQFIKSLSLNKFLPNAKKLSGFLNLVNYVHLDFTSPDIDKFSKDVSEITRKYSSGNNKMFYLALPDALFAKTANIIRDSGMLEGNGWKRVVFEKPFGHDSKSAKEINKQILSVFKEDQIYRVDHYLGKELVQSILAFRFANPIFKQVWNNKFVDNVQISMPERIGITGRGRYYDKAGAIRDMVQNHILQILSFVTMEQPKSLNSQDIKNEKVRLLKSLSRVKSEDVVIGQYSGYKQEADISHNSQTETFAAIKAYINNERWKGVPFYFKTGKRMSHKYSEVNIVLKDISCELFCKKDKHTGPNIITIRINPDEGFVIQFNTKIPGVEMKLDNVKMDFCHSCLYALNTPEAYEFLIYEVLIGDSTLFSRLDEVIESWKFIDSIKRGKLNIYKHGTAGPKEADKLIERSGRKWILHNEDIV